MSFLGSLFDPVGAVATDGNNNTFDSVFSPGDNLFGDQGLGFEPSWSQNLNNSYAEPAGNFADNVMDVNKDESTNLWNHFKSSPQQLVTGVDPFATKLWNGATNQKNDPWVGQYGGETNQDYQNSANRGINTEDGQYAGAVANAVAGWYGGQALGNLGSTAYSSSFPTTATSVASDGTGGMGSSALNVEAEIANPSVAGSGSSAAGWSAQGLDNGPTGIGAGGSSITHDFGNVTSGAGQGGANALNNNQNPFKGALQGGLRAGVGSNLDYAGAGGVDDPLYKAGINGAISGGVKTAMNGGDATTDGYGALIGALGGAVQQAGPTLSNWAGQAGNAVGNFFGGNNGGNGSSNGGTNPSTGTTNWGNLAAGLGNLYMSSRNNAGIQGQINNLGSMYGPNSAYATQMAQQLQRQDAAGGRGSQYGTRAVELQAALANANGRNAPTLANLYQQQRQNRFGQLAGMFSMARNSGMFDNSGSSNFNPVMSNQSYTPISAGPGDMTQMDPNQVNRNIMGTLPGGY